ncbi:MAG: hypothetical protein WC843_00090 [Candidatus Gracilibacteria bacterium]
MEFVKFDSSLFLLRTLFFNPFSSMAMKKKPTKKAPAKKGKSKVAKKAVKKTAKKVAKKRK